MNKIIFFSLALILSCGAQAQDDKHPVRIAMVGLTHNHALGFLDHLNRHKDVELAGIVETDPALIERYSKRYNLTPDLFYPSLEDLFAKTKVQAVAAFTSIYDHKLVVETCAAHGIDVMVEKPLATNMKAARAIKAAVEKSGIQLVVNYETTWYPGTQAAYGMVHDEHQIGELRKIVIHDGHRGPKEIGCPPEFLAWLTDPVQNGGGAMNDFGCYGADLATWFFDGQRPTSLFAVTQQIKPDVYPKVEDEATIVLTYPKSQAIIQASWNWPFSRKDMELYGRTGYVLVAKPDLLRLRTEKMPAETEVTLPPNEGPNVDSVAYLAAVERKEIKPSGLSSLAVNMVVVEILDAARKSALTGRRIDF